MNLYHNPRCSKSRKTKELLEEQGASFEVVEYLKNPLSVDELRDLCTLLGISPKDLLRTSESSYKTLVEEHGEPSDEDALLWMSEHPELMERPVVIVDDRAVVARPPEKVLSLL